MYNIVVNKQIVKAILTVFGLGIAAAGNIIGDMIAKENMQKEVAKQVAEALKK